MHGTLGDFRTWSSVMGPLSKAHRVIAVSLRHFFPEHWDGVGDDYLMSQHVADTIAFIAQIGPTPVDLMGHSRGGHIAFRVAQQRPDLLRKLVLLEPGGDLDASLNPAAAASLSTSLAGRTAITALKIAAGDIDGALENFFDGIEGDGAWARLPAPANSNCATISLRWSARSAKNARLTARRTPRRSRPRPFHRRRREQGQPASAAADPRRRGARLPDGDDRRRWPLDVRAGATGVLQDRAGVPRGMSSTLSTRPPAVAPRR